MVLSDFDRTLTCERDNFFVRDNVRRIVNEFSKRHLFFVVTGREKKYIDILAKELYPTGWIMENGAIILYGGKEIKLIDSSWYVTRSKIAEFLRSREIPHTLGEVIIYVNNALKYKQVLDMVKDAKVEWNRQDAMIMPPNVSKGNAVIYLKKLLGFNGKLIAIGDSENDIPLFKVVDIKVAVANALPTIKSIADVILDKEDGYGVTDFLNKIMNDEEYLERLIKSSE